MRLRPIFFGVLAFSVPLFGGAYAVTDSFDNPFFYGEWVPARYQFFGGCEAGDNVACIDWNGSDSFFSIGAAAVKQGMYTVEGPSFEDNDSRFLLSYQYQFITEEEAASQDDYGIIKVKDVASDTIYYYKTLYPTDETTDWVKQRVSLPNTITDQQLQLVFEVYNNDNDELSLMYINNVWAVHQSKPIITGTVTQENDLGKNELVSGATIYLKNKPGTKTLKTTTTDADGNFTFDPVKAKQKYKIVATFEDASGSVTTQKTAWGQTTYTGITLEE